MNLTPTERRILARLPATAADLVSELDDELSTIDSVYSHIYLMRRKGHRIVLMDGRYELLQLLKPEPAQ